jgi:hypothetical protein
MVDGHWKKELKLKLKILKEALVGVGAVEGIQKKEGLISQEAKRHNC